MEGESNAIMIKFLKASEIQFTPLKELKIGQKYQIKALAKKELSFEDSIINNIEDDRQVIMPTRFFGLFNDGIMDLVIPGREKLYFINKGMETNNGKKFHSIEFSLQ